MARLSSEGWSNYFPRPFLCGEWVFLEHLPPAPSDHICPSFEQKSFPEAILMQRDSTWFSRKHGEGFFRWIHVSYHHESHCKELSIIIRVIAQSHHESHCKELSSSESLRRVIIIIMRVLAKSYHHCTESASSESLQRVIIIRVIAKSYHHCTESSSSESLQRVIIIRVIAKSYHHQSHCKESSS